MKFTLDWLKEHLDTTASEKEITKALIDLGLEVESCTNMAEKFDHFVLGQILEIEKHPDAERLNLCLVDIGTQKIKVVCGATNVRSSMKVIFAKIGAIIPATNEVLKAGKIRGVESQGMLCSSSELMFTQNSDGTIMELQTDLPVGTPIAQVFNVTDVIFDLGITPNRSDCFSVHGIARDLAAKNIGTLKVLSKVQELKGEKQNHPICSHFFIAYIKGVKNQESPDFIKNRLKAVGMSCKNFLIDVTNYLTLDLGQPLHVHDANQGLDLTVRYAKTGETMFTLKEQALNLNEEDLVIASGEKILALAGIMGSLLSAVQDSTTDILIESAMFDPVKIALSGQRHKVASESRMRFERGVDPDMVSYAFYKTIEMVLQYCGGTLEFIHEKKTSAPEKILDFDIRIFEKKCGFPLEIQKAQKYLEKLGFRCEIKNEHALHLIIPHFRHDVSIQEDIVEELLRLEGFDRLPSMTLDLQPMNCEKTSDLKEKMVYRGLSEVYTWSMISEKDYALFSKEEPVRINNPITQNMAVMRSSILSGLLNVVVENQNKGALSVALFETAHVYSKQGEQNMLAGVRVGSFQERAWFAKERPVDVFDIKADCLEALPDMKMQLSRDVPFYYHPTKSGAFKQGKNVLAYFGELHPSVIKHFGLKGSVVGFEVFLDRIPPIKNKMKKIEISNYPFVPRDLCFIVESHVMADDMVQAIQKINVELIHDVSVFDVYEMQNKKSVAIEFYYQSLYKTLEEAEITDLTSVILKTMKEKFGAELRG